jgi:hypothetical protein
MNLSILVILSLLFNTIYDNNPLISNELENNDWETLFDGDSFDGWHRYNRGKVSSAWIIKDGAILMVPKNKGEDRKTHDIVTEKEYTNFELSLEWKISEGGNSGVLWAIQEDKKHQFPYQTGPEVQVIDNDRHPDAKQKPDFHQAGAVYDLVEPEIDNTYPAGEWNTFIININYNVNRGTIILNGKQISNFPLYGEAWDKLIANSKFADKSLKNFSKKRKGKIGLQDHGNVVAYKNIKIRELKKVI